MEKEDKRFALLIDGENVSAKYIKGILEELSNEGVITYKRIYGDWTSANMQRWKDVLLENSVTPIQQYSYTTGKNATDSAMIIDAMDILYSGNVDGFCLVSSDSDFTKLAQRLREDGMFVMGIGPPATPLSFWRSFLPRTLRRRLRQPNPPPPAGPIPCPWTPSNSPSPASTRFRKPSPSCLWRTTARTSR